MRAHQDHWPTRSRLGRAAHAPDRSWCLCGCQRFGKGKAGAAATQSVSLTGASPRLAVREFSGWCSDSLSPARRPGSCAIWLTSGLAENIALARGRRPVAGNPPRTKLPLLQACHTKRQRILLLLPAAPKSIFPWPTPAPGRLNWC